MISLRQRLHSLPGLGAGIVFGLLLALLLRSSAGITPAMLILMTAWPFVLAGLTGIAKTTTA
jgi:hypothetical protein